MILPTSRSFPNISKRSKLEHDKNKDMTPFCFCQRYYFQDGSGSTVLLADGSGNLLESYRYDLQGTPSFFDPTGKQLTASAYGIKDLFNGQRWMKELGLYDLRNRFYSPDIGRFIQPDPIGFGGGNNLYRYCGNNPVNGTDVLGLAGDSETTESKIENGPIDCNEAEVERLTIVGTPVRMPNGNWAVMGINQAVNNEHNGTGANASPGTGGGGHAARPTRLPAPPKDIPVTNVGVPVPVPDPVPDIDQSVVGLINALSRGDWEASGREFGNLDRGLAPYTPLVAMAVFPPVGLEALTGEAAETTAAIQPMAEAAFQTGTIRNVAGYELGGNAGLAGRAYNVNLWGLYRTESSQGPFALVNALKSEASAAGASQISITGNAVVNQGLLNISPGVAGRLGLQVQQIDPTTILLQGAVH